MEELAEYRQELLTALEDVINTLSKNMTRIPAEAWQTPAKLVGQTPHSILAKLLALESQVFGNQLRRIIEEDTPQMPLFDENAWMAEHYDPSKPAMELFNDFANLRRQEINWLKKLPVDSWSRAARHPWWGLRTLQWWVEFQLDYSHKLLRELAAS